VPLHHAVVKDAASAAVNIATWGGGQRAASDLMVTAPRSAVDNTARSALQPARSTAQPPGSCSGHGPRWWVSDAVSSGGQRHNLGKRSVPPHGRSTAPICALVSAATASVLSAKTQASLTNSQLAVPRAAVGDES